jgi:hypothetical protein
MPKPISILVVGYSIRCATRHLFEKQPSFQDFGEANRVEHPRYEI